MQRTIIQQEMERACVTFRELVERASAEELSRRSAGTRWTNRQLLFHMVFGYLIVRTLMPLVHRLGRIGWSRRFAATLNSLRRPLHSVQAAAELEIESCSWREPGAGMTFGQKLGE